MLGGHEGPGWSPFPGVTKNKGKCVCHPAMLKTPPNTQDSGRDPASALGTLPERYIPASFLAGHACCLGTMPLCGALKPVPGAHVSSASCPLVPPALGQQASLLLYGPCTWSQACPLHCTQSHPGPLCWGLASPSSWRLSACPFPDPAHLQSSLVGSGARGGLWCLKARLTSLLLGHQL